VNGQLLHGVAGVKIEVKENEKDMRTN
jgi:hypothetical protein